MPKSALPKKLQNKRHDDWIWPFKLIPRAWTAYKWGKPQEQYGNLNPDSPSDYSFIVDTYDELFHDFPKPITGLGTWQLSNFPFGPRFAWYFAFTTKKGLHFRIGARWDDVDNYVEFPSIAIKRLK